MLARAFRVVLLIELSVYLVLAWSLTHYSAWPAMQAAAAMLACALALRAGFVGATIAVSRLFASPAPPEHRLGALAWLRLYFSELGAYILLYNLYQPFERLFAGAEPLQPSPRWQVGRVLGLAVHERCPLEKSRTPPEVRRQLPSKVIYA